jgi:hypothetical protein
MSWAMIAWGPESWLSVALAIIEFITQTIPAS